MMNKEIIAYQAIGGFNSAELCKYVNEAIKDGWQPFMSPFLIDEQMIQAMVKYKESSAEESAQYVPNS